MPETADKRRARKLREYSAYGVSAALCVGVFGVPRIWLTAAEFRSEIGDIAGYFCIWWLNIILLMPTAARYWGGRWVTFMGVRKQLGIGVGFFIIAHGIFSHVLGSGAELAALNPGGSGAGFINFFLTIVLLITSIDRVRLSMARKWWEFHQRIGTFGITFLGTTASFGSSYSALAVFSQLFTGAVLVIRLAQYIHDRKNARRDRFWLNAGGFLGLLLYLILCRTLGMFYLLTAIAAALLSVSLIVHVLRRRRSGADRGRAS